MFWLILAIFILYIRISLENVVDFWQMLRVFVSVFEILHGRIYSRGLGYLWQYSVQLKQNILWSLLVSETRAAVAQCSRQDGDSVYVCVCVSPCSDDWLFLKGLDNVMLALWLQLTSINTDTHTRTHTMRSHEVTWYIQYLTCWPCWPGNIIYVVWTNSHTRTHSDTY